ncbi:hypothetical protein [Desulfitispora alkaliphila]|uniref:hypothetical protein n=1 Tax=Desulfitispora alkaliphila TaxID=622674 RepID=UPI003D1B6709
MLTITVGCTSENDIVLEDEDLLTVDDIILALEAVDISLKSTGSISVSEEPVAAQKNCYKINDTKDRLIIFVFPSIGKRVEYYKNTISDMTKIEVADVESVIPIKAKNGLLVYVTDETSLNGRNNDFLQRLNQIRKVAFEELNDTKELVFKGKGEYWEASVIVQYYKYRGNGWVEGTVRQKPTIKYNGSDVSEIDRVEIELNAFQYDQHTEEVEKWSSRRGRHIIDEQGYIRPPGSFGNGVIEEESIFYQINLDWNQMEDKFKLKKQAEI